MGKYRPVMGKIVVENRAVWFTERVSRGCHDSLYRNVCGGYHSDGECVCLFVTTTGLLIFLGNR